MKLSSLNQIFVIVALIIFSTNVKAQQIPSISQIRNVYDLNPATIGINQNFSLITRQVFSGVNGAPAINIVSLNKLVDLNMGVGLNVYDYKQGFTNQRGIKAGYAYRIHFKEDKFLSFGLSADIFKYIFNHDMINIKNPNDPAFTEHPYEQVGIDFDFGLSFNTPKFFFDVVVHQISGQSVALLNDFSENRRARHYFLYSGYKIPVSDKIEIEPSVFIKYIEMGIYHSDIGAKGIFNDLFWIGAYYRTNNIISAHAGLKMDRLSYGFAYEYGSGDIFNYSTGTWEFQFIYLLEKSRPKLQL